MATPRVAAAESADGEPRATGGAVLLEGVEGVGGAGRLVAARRRPAGEDAAVAADAGVEGARSATFIGHRPRRAPWPGRLEGPIGLSGGVRLTDSRYRPGEGASSRSAARSWRRRRLRTTAVPTGRPIAKATRTPPASSGTCSTRSERWRDRLPRSRSAANSPLVRTRPVRMRNPSSWTIVLRRGRSGREAGAALQAAIADDRPAGTGRHAVAEPVAGGPLAVVGLEGALHGLSDRSSGTRRCALGEAGRGVPPQR